MKIIKLSLFALCGFVSFQLNAQSLDEANRLSRNEQFEDAEKVFQELITAKPKEANFYYYAGLNQILKGDTVAANKMFNTGYERPIYFFHNLYNSLILSTSSAWGLLHTCLFFSCSMYIDAILFKATSSGILIFRRPIENPN